MEKPRFIDVGGFGVLHIYTTAGRGIVPFRVLAKQERPFDYGNHPAITEAGGLAPGAVSDPLRFRGTFAGRDIEDLFHYTEKLAEKGWLLHVWMDVIPRIVQVYPYWPQNYLQIDYGPIMSPISPEDWGYLTPPVEFVSVPYVHLEFRVKNPLGTETINPYFKFWYAWYRVRLVDDVDLVVGILQGRVRAKWFTVYGFKPWEYDLQRCLGITRPIPLTATREEVERILEEWRGGR